MAYRVNQEKLRKAWEAGQRSTKDDWNEWMRRFSVELLRESPAPALRACSALAQVYQPLARELFNAAFVSCWTELDGEGYQEYLVRSLETVFSSPETPPEILQALLNLAEFMEHDDKALPIDIRYLGEHAEKCHAFAKALHYKELEFQSSPESCIESLISINNQLEQHEAAVGILKYAQEYLQRSTGPAHGLPAPRFGISAGGGPDRGVSPPKLVEVKESWFEKLGRWDDALRAYETRLVQLGPHPGINVRGNVELSGDPVDSSQYVELTLGRMRCLDALGEFEKVAGLARELWPLLTSSAGQRITNPRVGRCGTVANRSGAKVVHGQLCPKTLESGGECAQRRQRRGRLSGSCAGRNALRPVRYTPPATPLGGAAGPIYAAIHRSVASLAARASWALEEWVAMERYVAATDSGVVEGALMRAVLSIQHARYARAQAYIDQARVLLDAPLTALVGESYNRVYKTLVVVQQLAELEEIVDYKRRWGTDDVIVAARKDGTLTASPQLAELRMASRRRMHSMWCARLEGCQRQVSVWSSLISVRSLVFSPLEDVGTWLKFAGICRRSGRHSLCLKTLMRLGIVGDNRETTARYACFGGGSQSYCRAAVPTLDPRVAFAYLKYLWAVGAKHEAVRRLRVISEALEVINSHPVPLAPKDTSDKECLLHLRTKLQLKLGNWVLHLHEQRRARRLHGKLNGARHGESNLCSSPQRHGRFTGFTKADDKEFLQCVIPDVLTSFRQATELSPLSYKAWHAWALMNFQAASVYGRADRLQYHARICGDGVRRHSFEPQPSISLPAPTNHVPLQRCSGADLWELYPGHRIRRRAATVALNRQETMPVPISHSANGASHPTCGAGGVLKKVSCEAGCDDHYNTSQQSRLSMSKHSDPSRVFEVQELVNCTIYKDVTGGENEGGIEEKKGAGKGNEEDLASVTTGERDRADFSTRASVHLVPAIHGFFRSIALGGFAVSDVNVVKLGRDGGGSSTASAAVLQDILRLLTLWFDHGHRPEVHAALEEGLGLGAQLSEHSGKRTIVGGPRGGSINVATWLQVIPQLIARVHYGPATSLKGNPKHCYSNMLDACAPHLSADYSPGDHIRDVTKDGVHRVQSLLHALLSRVGNAHPQALIYPLTVASTSTNKPRRRAALSLLDAMRANSSVLVEQALLVSRELIRVAIIWHEMWHGALEEASRQWFGDKDAVSMTETLEPLHQMMEDGPETLHEVGFHHAFGRDLQEAHGLLRKYRRNGNEQELAQAWEIYYHVFRKINKHLPSLTTLELQYVSPALLKARNLELAVPGTYSTLHSHVRPFVSEGRKPMTRGGRGVGMSSKMGAIVEPNFPGTVGVVKISSIAPTLNVITSKQRPRKVMMRGSDGKLYQFLLKGHEDLRQDERVMQLFGLVNALLDRDADTSKRDLSIQRYEVIPLSHDVGLVGWVPSCDTLHQLIREYRDARKVLLNIEHRLMLQMAPEYDRLTLMQKVEVFQSALENTTGQDLYKILWLKSPNSEVWLDRRTNYTRSLAVMSMVGYVLGLGDRHPSNLMLDRYSGKIVHIDFGDCFEVAMHREKYPEKIPFRLTRMLVNAMEVSGIEGNFRPTCEAVMRVLRDNRDSVMAMLEAFVHDPLINWRLLATTKPADKEGAPPLPTATKLNGGDVATNNRASDMHKRLQCQEKRSHGQEAPYPWDTACTTDVAKDTGKNNGDRYNPSSSAIAAGMMGLASASLPVGSLVLGSSVQNRSGRERDLRRNLAASVKARNGATRKGLDNNMRDGTIAPKTNIVRREPPCGSEAGLDSNCTFNAGVPAEELNSRAVAVIERVHAKLTGHDFSKQGSPTQRLDVQTQVQLLIEQAMAHENLCRSYIGWCPFW